MRRVGFIAIAALALIALAAPVVDARHGGHSTTKAATIVAHTNVATQGGALQIMAKVKHPQRGATFSASATVHFASGDVTVSLARHGKSFTAAASTPVASDETPGAVPVDVTVTYEGSDQQVETDATVEQDTTDTGGDQGDQSCDPATTTCTGDDQGDQGGDQGGNDPGTGG